VQTPQPAAPAPGHRFAVRPLLLTVYLPSFLVAVGQGAVLPIIPLFAKELGAGVALAGTVFAMRGLGTLVFDLPAGVAVSRFGDRRTLAVSAGVMAVAGLGAWLSTSVLQLAIFTFVFGGSFGTFQLSRLAYVSEVTAVAHRGRALALVGGVNRVGIFVGPVIGGLLAQYFGLDAAFLAQAVAALAALAIILVFVHENHTGVIEGDRGVYGRVVGTLVEHRRAFLTAGLAVVALQLLRAGRQILIPLWGDAIGLEVAAIGLAFGASSAIDMTLFYPMGVVMDRWGRKWAAVPSLLVLSFSLALIPLTQSFWPLVAVGVLSGIGNGLGSGIVQTLGADLSPSGARGEFLGVWRLIGDVGTAAGPFVVGAVAQLMTLALASLAMGGVGLAGAAVMAFLAAETLTRSREHPPARVEPPAPS
jgi:MFS family permease